MNVRIVERPELYLVGHVTRLPLTSDRHNPHMQEFVSSLTPQERRRLAKLGDTEPAGLLQVTADATQDDRGGGEVTYMLGAAVADASAVPEDLRSVWVAAGSWAVVRTEGPHPQTLQDAWAAVETEWLPSQPWQRRPGPAIVAVMDHDEGSAVATAELWLPVERPVERHGAHAASS